MESECSGKWGDEDGGASRERAPLSPVSEDAAGEMREDDELEMTNRLIEAGAAAPPDGGWGWVIVFASFMCNMIVDGIAYSFGVFLPQFADEPAFKGEDGTGGGTAKAAWVGSLLCGVYLLVGPVVSALTNKFGCRVVCIVGSLIACFGFAISSFSTSLDILILTYGIIGGVGFGFIYLPAVVCVGYYFESKRALATGIAVCGSGVGTFVFAPFSAWLLEISGGWRNANLVFAGIIFCCCLFGALMKPLEVSRDELDIDVHPGGDNLVGKPLLLRMAEDKRNYLEKGSLAGSTHFMVQLPDGTMEKRLKIPLNVDPGVHSSFNLDQIVPGTPITPNPNPAPLPPIAEAKTVEGTSTAESGSSKEGSDLELKGKENGEVKGTDQDEEEPASGSLPVSEHGNRPFGETPIISMTVPEPISEEKEELGSMDFNEEPPLIRTSSASRRILMDRRRSEGIYSSSPMNIRQAELSRSPTRSIPIRPGGGVGGSGLGPLPAIARVAGIPRNESAPQFNQGRSIPKNGSVPLFDRMGRKHSFRAVPLGSVHNRPSRPNLQELRKGSVPAHFKTSLTSFMSSKNNNSGNQEDDFNSLFWSKGELSEGIFFSSSQRPSAESRHIIRPLSRKDIFYSGSILHLPEYQSQRNINSYRQSVLNIPNLGGGGPGGDEGDVGDYMTSSTKDRRRACPCHPAGSGAFKTALAELMDFSLLRNPTFLFIGVSNVFGMLGFYVPFVYIMSYAIANKIEKDQAAFLLSVIGITNTIGRVATGLVSDLPQVNSLFLNNMCILLSGLCVSVVPFCSSYASYIVVSMFFGLFVSGYCSLTSIILVDLLGLDNLTNAFGLLILFRGAASIIGAPLAGAVFAAFNSYEVPFFLAGGFLIISALISFLVPCAQRFSPPPPVLEPRVSYGGYLPDIPEAPESTHHSTETQLQKSPLSEEESRV